MEPGSQVMLVVINNGVVVQHPPEKNVVQLPATEQTAPVRNVAMSIATFDELVSYLKDLGLFQDEA